MSNVLETGWVDVLVASTTKLLSTSPPKLCPIKTKGSFSPSFSLQRRELVQFQMHVYTSSMKATQIYLDFQLTRNHHRASWQLLLESNTLMLITKAKVAENILKCLTLYHGSYRDIKCSLWANLVLWNTPSISEEEARRWGYETYSMTRVWRRFLASALTFSVLLPVANTRPSSVSTKCISKRVLLRCGNERAAHQSLWCDCHPRRPDLVHRINLKLHHKGHFRVRSTGNSRKLVFVRRP